MRRFFYFKQKISDVLLSYRVKDILSKGENHEKEVLFIDHIYFYLCIRICIFFARTFIFAFAFSDLNRFRRRKQLRPDKHSGCGVSADRCLHSPPRSCLGCFRTLYRQQKKPLAPTPEKAPFY